MGRWHAIRFLSVGGRRAQPFSATTKTARIPTYFRMRLERLSMFGRRWWRTHWLCMPQHPTAATLATAAPAPHSRSTRAASTRMLGAFAGRGGDLASIHSARENAALPLRVARRRGSGYSDAVSGKLGVADNTSTNYTNWAPGEPNGALHQLLHIDHHARSPKVPVWVCVLPFSAQDFNHPPLPCVRRAGTSVMRLRMLREWRQDSHWDDCGDPASCDAAYSFLCRLPASAPQAPLLTAPVGLAAHGRKCYKLEGSASKQAAGVRHAYPRRVCRAPAEDANEQRFIEEHFGCSLRAVTGLQIAILRPISMLHMAGLYQTLPLIAALRRFSRAGTIASSGCSSAIALGRGRAEPVC